MWRLSTGCELRLRRRSANMRRSRTTSLLSSANTCLRYRYCLGSVRDTMKSKSAMIASPGFQPLTVNSLNDGRPGEARRAAQCGGKLSCQKTPRPERRKADALTVGDLSAGAHDPRRPGEYRPS